MKKKAVDRQANRRVSERIEELFHDDQGVFMISVAAELAGMHPQTLRIYEGRGLIKPKRSPKQTRLYSRSDVERLRRIQELTTTFGLNLAGVERVLELEELMDAMQEQLEAARRQAEELEREMLARIEQVHRSYKRELVVWKPLAEPSHLSANPSDGLPADGNRSRRRR